MRPRAPEAPAPTLQSPCCPQPSPPTHNRVPLLSSPLFYFGHGLSYASGFAASGVSCAPPPATTLFQAGDTFVISGTITAASAADPASRVSLLLFYSQDAPTKYTRFDHQLMGFTKVSVPAGGAGSAPFALEAKIRDLDAFEPDVFDYVVYSGRYTLTLAFSAAPADLAKPLATFSINVNGTYAWSRDFRV